MRVLRTVAQTRVALQSARLQDRTIGLVPTMGALHGGHLSLIDRARAECDLVVVSLFVNPTQFEENADLDRYPRQQQHDHELAATAGADLLFAPTAEEIYPDGFSTSVEVLGLTDRLEGAVRGAGHFRGVTTVVAKLLNIVAPDIAYFGQKDAQQAIVIRRMVEDLNMDVQIETCPTVRDADGLAMSSRNVRLSERERDRALAIPRALAAATAAAAGGERSADALIAAAREALRALEAEPEYVALVQADTLDPVVRLEQPTLLAIAARVGETRLIDNAILSPDSSVASSASSQPDFNSTFPASQFEKQTDPRQAKPREAQATCSA
ncbi:MAG TPA: pantoate--beta-alanine ligase [Solirubrobacteraceae bacterium]|nr:pantoate--beta-alanine ligase [Solirubrobacteraceae bacterium]